jgi:D-serine deaminase-like pyridoxal phosphate-dependent protein
MQQENRSRRNFLKQAFGGVVGVSVLGAGVAAWRKPADISADYSSYFAGINRELQRAGIGEPTIIIDLDRVDHNLHEIVTHIIPPVNYRIVTKSLPSVELLKYVMQKSGSQRLMAFHAPYLTWMMREFPGADILLGKPLLVDSARAFYRGLTPADQENASGRIQWLVDTPVRLETYLVLAEELGIRLCINIEIDVGLKRGGVEDLDTFATLLGIIADHPERLIFTGLMGYDAHVPHAPPLISSVGAAFRGTLGRYGEFVAFGQVQYPDLFKPGLNIPALTFNSGGSSTYFMFANQAIVNDVAAGSAVVKPATFGSLTHHQPALFIAAPVLKKMDGIQLPFLGPLADLMQWWNPNMGTSLYLYGGGWAADIVSPPGVMLNELAADPPNQNLQPNQSLYHVSKRSPLQIGDFVFFQPQQGDAISQFERLLVMRDGRLVDTWHSFPSRY